MQKQETEGSGRNIYDFSKGVGRFSDLPNFSYFITTENRICRLQKIPLKNGGLSRLDSCLAGNIYFSAVSPPPHCVLLIANNSARVQTADNFIKHGHVLNCLELLDMHLLELVFFFFVWRFWLGCKLRYSCNPQDIQNHTCI